jgi:hypothetical protein
MDNKRQNAWSLLMIHTVHRNCLSITKVLQKIYTFITFVNQFSENTFPNLPKIAYHHAGFTPSLKDIFSLCSAFA